MSIFINPESATFIIFSQCDTFVLIEATSRKRGLTQKVLKQTTWYFLNSAWGKFFKECIYHWGHLTDWRNDFLIEKVYKFGMMSLHCQKKNNLSKTDICFFSLNPLFFLPGSHLVPKNWQIYTSNTWENGFDCII